MHTDGAIYTLSSASGAIYDEVEVTQENYLEEYQLGLYYFKDYTPTNGVKSIKFRYYRPNGNLIEQQNLAVTYIRRGMKSFVELWQLTTTATKPAKPASSTSIGSWSTDTSLLPDETHPYLWNVEIVQYTDGTEVVMEPENIATWRKGRGISSHTDYYQITATGDTPAKPSSSQDMGEWKTDNTIRATAEKPYLWNLEVIKYDDNTEQITDPTTIGVWMKGDDGRGLTTITEYWQLTTTSDKPAKPTSSTSLGSWTTDSSLRPSLNNPYLWNVEIVHYTDGTESIMEPENIATYIQGRGITSITDYYQLSASSTPPDKPTSSAAMGQWSTDNTLQTDAYQPYLWNLEVIKYNDGSEEITNPTTLAIWQQGADGKSAIEIATTEIVTFSLRQNGKAMGQIKTIDFTAYKGGTEVRIYSISTQSGTVKYHGVEVTIVDNNTASLTSTLDGTPPSGEIVFVINTEEGYFNKSVTINAVKNTEYQGSASRWSTGITYKKGDVVLYPYGNYPIYRALQDCYNIDPTVRAYWEEITKVGGYISWNDTNLYTIGATYERITKVAYGVETQDWSQFDSLQTDLRVFDDIMSTIENVDDDSIEAVKLVKKLAVSVAMINALIVRKVLLKDGGYIESENYASGAGLKIDENGEIRSGNYDEETGTGYLLDKDGKLHANEGTFAGDLSAAGGTFSGDLSAAGGTFAGDLSAAGGTFSGDLSAAGGTFAGDLSAAGGTFSGDLSAVGGTFKGELKAATGTFTGSITASGFSLVVYPGSVELTRISCIVGSLQPQHRTDIVFPATGEITLRVTIGSKNPEETVYFRIFKDNYSIWTRSLPAHLGDLTMEETIELDVEEGCVISTRISNFIARTGSAFLNATICVSEKNEITKRLIELSTVETTGDDNGGE